MRAPAVELRVLAVKSAGIATCASQYYMICSISWDIGSRFGVMNIGSASSQHNQQALAHRRSW